jgi:hypothetical protein
MKLRILSPFLAVIILAATSCKKETSDDQNSSGLLTGTWKFVSNVGVTTASTATSFMGMNIKVETVTSFASSNPKGAYKFGATSVNYEGVGYDYSGSLIIRQYQDNALQSADTTALDLTLPPSNASTPYKLVGTDSIYFETNAPGSTSTAAPGGCKYKLEGNKLTFFVNTNTTTTTNQGGGLISTDNVKSNLTVVLEKQ